MGKGLNDLEIYREAMDLGEAIWDLVAEWNHFAKDTVGRQGVRAADSVAANLAEGHGRYHFKENRMFCYYARGSAEETQTWIEKGARRGLIDREIARELYGRIEALKKRINAYIGSLKPRPAD